MSDSAELKAHLQSMKRLLKKKERSLTRYNRAKAKDVRNIVLRKNFENSRNGNEEFSDLNNCTSSDSDVSRTKFEKSDLFEENPSNSEPVKKDKNSKYEISDLQSFHTISSVSKISSASRNYNAKKLVSDDDVEAETSNLLGIADQNLHGSVNTQINDSNSITPVLHRKRVIKHNIFNKKKYAKRLFQNKSNDNNNDIGSKCPVKDNCDREYKSSCSEELHYTSPTKCEHVENNLKSSSGYKICAINTLQENNFFDKSRTVIDDCETPLIKQPISVHRYNTFSDAFEGDLLLHSCLSLPTNSSPYALILFNRKFSIYNLRKDEATDNLTWQQCHQQTSDVNQDLNTRKFCSLGGGWDDLVYFCIIKAPKTTGCSFEMIFLSFYLEEQLRIIQKPLPLQGCPTCSFTGHDLQHWSFLFLHHCENPSCPNSSMNYQGTFNTITFDLKYSQKWKEWNLEFERSERRRLSDYHLVTVNLLHGCTLNSSSECPNIFWQDSLGKFGVSTQGCSFELNGHDSSYELREEITSSLVIFAAVVKEILLLILKSKEYLKILAMNPLSCEFDVLEEIKLSDFNGYENRHCSVVFYENKFLVSSEAEIFSIDI